jgi:hypothetical protein
MFLAFGVMIPRLDGLEENGCIFKASNNSTLACANQIDGERLLHPSIVAARKLLHL